MFELYGCHRDDFVAAYDAWVARIHSDDKDEQEKISADAVNGLREYNTEFRILHPDGNLRYIKASAIVLRDDRGNPLKMIGTNWDITEQKLHEEHLQGLVQTEITKRLENERMLLQQSKMAMMGEMMGAIAHQWRQPLNSLGIKIQDVMVSHAVGELDDEYVREFQDSSMILIQRMSKTIDDFRNFFKPVDKKSDFDLKSAFEDSMNIIGVQLKSYGIGVGFVSDSSSLVNGYKGELEQAILIIMSNAQDKLLENKTKNPKIDISIKEIESSKIELSINDNAGGVPEEIIDRIFEPYFTTKFQMQGTGIGLYIAKEIVERHMNGKLTVQNANGGARFSMVFDLAKSLQ